MTQTDPSTDAGSSDAVDPFADVPPGSRRARSFEPSPPRHMRPHSRFGRTATRALWSTMLPPVFLGIAATEAARSGTRRVGERLGVTRSIPPDPHPFSRSTNMPPRSDATVADITAVLEQFPWNPRRLRPQDAFFLDSGNDGVALLAETRSAFTALPHLYPPAFQPRLFSGAHGVQVAALEALHRREGPALIICHGLFSNKHFDYVRRVALRAFYNWGFHVVVVDLRAHGQTAWTGPAPSSAGYYEGADIVSVSRALRRDPLVTSVGAMGFSLGGASVLNAARFASAIDPDILRGGVLALGAPALMQEATEYVSTRPPVHHPFFGLWLMFWTGIQIARRDRRTARDLNDWASFVRADSLPWYGVTEEEFYRRASSTEWAQDIRVPTMEIHAADDFVVPVKHAEALRDAAEGNDNVAVRIMDRGAHAAFGSVDDRWYRSTVRRWFEYWAEEAPPVRPV